MFLEDSRRYKMRILSIVKSSLIEIEREFLTQRIEVLMRTLVPRKLVKILRNYNDRSHRNSRKDIP
jgi:hypothetical protein